MKLLREPLLHFALGGAILFAGYAWVNREQVAVNGPEPLRIGVGELRWLRETWTSQWLREPSAQELQGLVADLLTEELLAREAREMGLDKNDTIVRRRLAQKLKFLVEDTTQFAAPAQDELRKFHAANPARFQTAARVSFTHVYFNPAQRKDAASDAKLALAGLSEPGARNDAAATTGDRFLLDSEYRDADELTVSSLFGPDFARAVFALEPGTWSGPITSGFGVHLVSVTNLTAAKQRPFEEVQGKVLEEWRRVRETAANHDYIARLREKHEVILDDSVRDLLGFAPTAEITVR